MPQSKDTPIRIRDRREPQQFSIHNHIIDHWFPIITAKGYALYSLYCRMANKDEERCYPGYRMIAKHMGMGVSTVCDYNKLLVWCGLIHIQPGKRNFPNDYYILDIPTVTPERLAHIKQAAQAERASRARDREVEATRLEQNGLTAAAAKLRQKKGSQFLKTIPNRLHKWQPIQAYWGEEKARPPVVRPGQLPLFAAPVAVAGDPMVEHSDPIVEQGDPVIEQGDPVVEHPDPVVEQGDPRSGSEQSKSNNPKQQSKTNSSSNSKPPPVDNIAAATPDTTYAILLAAGIVGKPLARLSRQPPHLALAWLWSCALERMACKYTPGYIVNQLRHNTHPPPALLDLAQGWLQMDASDREVLRALADSTMLISQTDAFAGHIPETYFQLLYEDSLNAFYKLYRTQAYLCDW